MNAGINSIKNDIKKSAQKKESRMEGIEKPACDMPWMVNEVTLNSGTRIVTKNKIIKLIIQRKAPKVRKLIGVSKIFRRGLTRRFKTAKKKDAQKRISKLSEKFKPPINLEIINKEKKLIIIDLKKLFIDNILPYF